MKTPFRILLIATLAFLTYNVQGQTIDLSKFEAMKPRNIGPAGMSGRVTAIDVVENNPEVMYVGTASGGLWKSTSGGINWEPIFEKEPVMSIGSVAIDQSNPDVVWAGTGEGNPRNSNNGGNGIYKSLDGGKTWKHMGLTNTRHIYRVIVHRSNSDIVYAAAIGSPWMAHKERGVYRTKDGGETWEQVLYVNELTGAADMVVDPKNPNKLFVAMWEHQRRPWTFHSGGPGSGLYMTVDGGDTWEKRTSDDGLPEGDLGRIGLAVAPSNSNVVYAIVESKKNAFYRSTDGGYTWEMRNNTSSIGGRPFYYSEIYVDPLNENRVYSLYTYVNVSEDGGKHFERFANSYTLRGIHPDHHAWYIHPTNPNFMIDGNDGGLNITRDRGKSWRFAENLPLAQFYHINVDMDVPYNVYGGMQDNGSWAGPGYVFKSGGIRNSHWQEVMFGDGFDVVPDPDDSRFGYAMSQGGSVGRYDKQTGYTQSIRPTHPDPEVQLRFNWNAPIAQDPHSNSTIYYGSQFLHKSTDKGNTWEIISPDLTTNDPEKQKQYESGGLTMDATGAENNTTILSIAPSPLDVNVIWVGTDDGNVQLTRDGGISWTNLTSIIPGMPKESWVAQIKASTYSAGEAFVVVNNYRMGDYTPYLFYTSDFGATWKNLVTAQIEGFTLSFIQDFEQPNLMFLGTEQGLFVSIDRAKNWTKWDQGYPSVPTADMVIHPREHDLVIGSYGRAAWVFDDIRPLRTLATEGATSLDASLKVFPAPDAYLAANQQAEGSRFPGNAMYIGENRNRGAQLSVWINRPEKDEPKTDAPVEKTKKSKRKKQAPTPVEEATPDVAYDTLTIEIYSGAKKIRTLKRAPKENGLHRFGWGMNQKGTRGPSRRKYNPNGQEPGGASVLPGEYRVVMHFGDQKDSTQIRVLADPRRDISVRNLEARWALRESLDTRTAKLTEAMDRLVYSKEIISNVNKQLKEFDGPEYDSLQKLGKTTQKAIDAMMDKIVGPDNRSKQGIVGSKERSITNYLYTARSYIGAGTHSPGATEQRTLDHLDEVMTPVLKEVNEFFTTDWPVYRNAVEETDLSPFKSYEPIETN